MQQQLNGQGETSLKTAAHGQQLMQASPVVEGRAVTINRLINFLRQLEIFLINQFMFFFQINNRPMHVGLPIA